MRGLKYFANKSWADITREERYFCAELFFDIKKNTKAFIEFLNERLQRKFDADQHWEVGFEVCFYRDFLFSIGHSVKVKYRGKRYLQKRTFDLCLFSNKKIILIEAKVDQKFDTKQLDCLIKDSKNIISILDDYGKSLEVETLLLNSSNNEVEVPGFNKITWKDISNLYRTNFIYRVADELPLRKKGFQININLSKKLPSDFSISYTELKEWHLGKYKPNPKLKKEIFQLDSKSIRDIDIIYSDDYSIAGRFSIPVVGNDKITSIPVDLMIAKQIFEKTKNRIGFKTVFFNQLSAKQIHSLHNKIINKIVPIILEKLKQEGKI